MGIEREGDWGGGEGGAECEGVGGGSSCKAIGHSIVRWGTSSHFQEYVNIPIFIVGP